MKILPVELFKISFENLNIEISSEYFLLLYGHKYFNSLLKHAKPKSLTLDTLKFIWYLFIIIFACKYEQIKSIITKDTQFRPIFEGHKYSFCFIMIFYISNSFTNKNFLLE